MARNTKGGNTWNKWQRFNGGAKKHIELYQDLYQSEQWQSLKPNSRLVLMAIIGNMGKHGGIGAERVICSYTDITEFTGIKYRRTIKRCLDELVAYQFIEIERGGICTTNGEQWKSNTYKLCDTWKNASISKAKAELKKQKDRQEIKQLDD